jgi:hypothetical protein
MTDMMEIGTGDEMTTRIVAVAEAVTRAADELKRAAEQLTTAMSLLGGLPDPHSCKAWVEERERGGASHRVVFLPDVMEGADPHAPGMALREQDGTEDEPVTI